MHPEILKSPAPKRAFLPSDLVLNSWEDILPFFNQLLESKISTESDLKNWIHQLDELGAFISEDMAKRYIYMTVDTTDEAYRKSYELFVQEIAPPMKEVSDSLNKKLVKEVAAYPEVEKSFPIYLRGVKNEIDLFRKENIPLQAELASLSSQFGAIAGGMSVKHDGKELTMQQAGKLIKEPNRELRETIYFKIGEERLKYKDQLDDLLSKMIKLRHQVAINAGFDNYRDYKFQSLGRFDFGAEDCNDFHESVAELVRPINEAFNERRKKQMGLEKLKPWDLAVDPEGRKALKPFGNSEELVEKAVAIFKDMDDRFGQCLDTMNKNGHFDLDSRKGKAPGGYNYPLAESGLPFIFMNSTNSFRDLVTFMHEGGHAVHSFLSEATELSAQRSTPAEVAEVASMAMELMSMKYWDRYFKNAEELKRAKQDQLEQGISGLSWIALVDNFQHWLYLNPEHSVEERHAQWESLTKKYLTSNIDKSDTEHFAQNAWQGQLHIFEVPFYYIEYGFAQLGAFAMWREFDKDNSKGIAKYCDFLSVAYTKSVPEIYQEGGIEFNFSKTYIKEILEFVQSELKEINEA